MITNRQVGVFTDFMSVTYNAGVNTCGARQYSISSTLLSATTGLSSTELTIDSSTGLISLYTANSATIGTHSVIVQANLMGSYASIFATLSSFTIYITPCVVTGYTMTLTPDYDKTYSIWDTTLTWSLSGSILTT